MCWVVKPKCHFCWLDFQIFSPQQSNSHRLLETSFFSNAFCTVCKFLGSQLFWRIEGDCADCQAKTCRVISVLWHGSSCNDLLMHAADLRCDECFYILQQVVIFI